MLAHAFVTMMAATTPSPDQNCGLIAVTRSEIRRLLAQLSATWPAPPAGSATS